MTQGKGRESEHHSGFAAEPEIMRSAILWMAAILGIVVALGFCYVFLILSYCYFIEWLWDVKIVSF